MAFPAREVFKIAAKLDVSQVLVNPFDPIRKPIRRGGILSRNEFMALAQGMVLQRTLDATGQVLTVQKQTIVQIGRNRVPIDERIKTRLSETAQGLPEVEQIFRYRLRYEDTGAQSEVFGLVCTAAGSPVTGDYDHTDELRAAFARGR